ncbi:hypothetical protein [Pseudomonas aeruginosa]|uniref:hypothetical protein n=1 Tax=Pseudomonas aeruginosa TaxID=287 RepID=UPI000F6C6CEB|nr:hypothetical protein [Pseudomonas aeruginosa]VEF98778.1 Uncharacterised protein [Pseudomonas aeruginosa]VEF98844.1 Uncharacterised protein [Pseudomonas aeruginosa]
MSEKIDMEFARRDDCLERMVPSDLRILISERDKAEAETQALREEVAKLRARVVVVPDAANDRRKSAHYCRGWNACLDELARRNGKTVSEGLLRRLCEPLLSHADYVVARNELRALLSEQE